MWLNIITFNVHYVLKIEFEIGNKSLFLLILLSNEYLMEIIGLFIQFPNYFHIFLKTSLYN